MYFKLFFLALVFFLFISGGKEFPSIKLPLVVIHTLDPLDWAIIKASAETNVPINYLRGIVNWECNNDLSTKVKNTNGTFDLGPGLNSRWIGEYTWRFNKGKHFDPHSIESIIIVARILANNYKVFHNWNWTISSYRRGVIGTIEYGIDKYYVDNVKLAGEIK